jgi:nitrate/TMAO reductase-like tetraheme cytochrome c subunit
MSQFILQGVKAKVLTLLFSFRRACLSAKIMNPVYNPAQPGVPYANQKGIAYPGKILFVV